MRSIGDILQKREQRKLARSERAEIIKQFLEELNAERDGVKYKKLTPYVVAYQLSHIKKKSDLYAFLSMCRDRKMRGESFGKFFWWSLKPKENPQKKLFQLSTEDTLTKK